MHVVKKTENGWERLSGDVRLERVENTCLLHYHDGRPDEVIICDPYPVSEAPVSANKIEALVLEGIWDGNDLSLRGLRVAEPFDVPDGKRTVGEHSYIESKGVIREHYEVEDVPPPAPPLTPGEEFDAKMAAIGFGPDDLAELARRLTPVAEKTE